MAKFDELGCMIRERYPKGDKANLGDSCAETSRMLLLGNSYDYSVLRNFFSTSVGYLRHPSLSGVAGWDEADFSNDQLVPWLMALDLHYPDHAAKVRRESSAKIAGTNTPVQLATRFLISKSYRLLNLANIAQGLLLALPFRFGDGGKLESSAGQVQDYLNMICIYVFLKRTGRWATLPRSREACMRAVTKYYLEGADAELNSEWIVNAYAEAILTKGTT
jgi:hypothetical protein